MIPLLMLLLLFQPLTVQDQGSSRRAPAVEVLDLEVLAEEFMPRRLPDPRTAPPPGMMSRDDIAGRRRETSRTEQPTIESRSRELGKVSRRSAQLPRQPAVVESTPWYNYEYRVRVKNLSPKKIKAIIWEYRLTDASSAVVSEHLFRCAGSVKSGDIKVLKVATPSPPSRVVSADNSEKQQAVVNWVEYTDGSTWVRDGWKHDSLEAAELLYGRRYHCVIVGP